MRAFGVIDAFVNGELFALLYCCNEGDVWLCSIE